VQINSSHSQTSIDKQLIDSIGRREALMTIDGAVRYIPMFSIDNRSERSIREHTRFIVMIVAFSSMNTIDLVEQLSVAIG
jgi:hypothetical protein